MIYINNNQIKKIRIKKNSKIKIKIKIKKLKIRIKKVIQVKNKVKQFKNNKNLKINNNSNNLIKIYPLTKINKGLSYKIKIKIFLPKYKKIIIQHNNK